MNGQELTPVTRWFLESRSQIRRALRTRLSRAEEIDDLAQEVYLRLLRVPQPQLVENPTAYACRIALNVAQKWQQRAAQALDHGAPLDDIEAVDDPQRETSTLQEYTRVFRCLKALPVAQRTAIILHVVDGLTCQEVADHMGTSRRAVKRYVANGYTAIRSSLVASPGAVS
jgi:RNA polymerase sigma-70 factor (ECF subfamily)